MATTVLTYNSENAAARHMLDVLLASGLFTEVEVPNATTLAAIEEAREAEELPTVDTSSVDAFLATVLQ